MTSRLTSGRTTGIAGPERQALCDLFEQVGPDAPTLCEGWTTADLAGHLVVREGRPDAGLAIIVPSLRGYAARIEKAAARRPWPALVDTLRQGPPLGRSAVSLPGLTDRANVHEFFVHHEDVRRAKPSWVPRALRPELEASLRTRLPVVARLLLRRLRGTTLELALPDGQLHTVGRGEPHARLSGPVSELTLWAFGRDAVQVELDGDPEAVAAVRSLPRGL